MRVELDAAPGRSVTVPLTKAHLGNATAADYSGIPMNVTFAANRILWHVVASRLPQRDLDTPSGKTVGVGKEIDAFLLEALRRHPTAPGSMVKENRTREAVYLDWLAERLAPAATLDRPASRLARFRRIRVARGDRGPEGPAATVHGTMTVTDPSAFARLLAHGVGRHRAYGYGMLLLRPPNHPAPER